MTHPAPSGKQTLGFQAEVKQLLQLMICLLTLLLALQGLLKQLHRKIHQHKQMDLLHFLLHI